MLFLARAFGTNIIDRRTGEHLGRALIIPWRGKIHVIGLATPARLEWLPQDRATYWRQEIGFQTHPPVDFPNERESRRPVDEQNQSS